MYRSPKRRSCCINSPSADEPTFRFSTNPSKFEPSCQVLTNPSKFELSCWDLTNPSNVTHSVRFKSTCRFEPTCQVHCAHFTYIVGAAQAAMAVTNHGLRPPIPEGTPSPLASLMKACWAPTAGSRPTFPQVVDALSTMQQEVGGITAA
jgi:hypothetical protein